jgi:hypothetical protein
MKHKRRRAGNPLAEYRRLQRQLRELYDPFTAKHCATCATPCCVKPTRVTPFDVALAEATGHAFPHLAGDPYTTAVADASHRLGSIPLPMASDDEAVLEYCEFLHKGRCTFPDDLRPYGCTVFVCKPMYEHMAEDTVRKVRRLVRQLDEVHVALVSSLADAGMLPPDPDDG